MGHEKYQISIERDGRMVPVGSISGESYRTATFSYIEEYLDDRNGWLDISPFIDYMQAIFEESMINAKLANNALSEPKWSAYSHDFSRESAGFRFPIQGEDSIIDRTMREKEVCGDETRESGGSIERKNCAN